MSEYGISTIKDEALVKLYVSSQRNMYFEEIYERYSDKVYRKCYSFVKDQARAEDLAHDIFLKVITKIGTFKESSKFSTWLYSITYNYCMDSLRKSQKMKEDPLDYPLDVMEEGPEDELFEMKQDGLQKSLDQIAPIERAILLMKYQDNFSIKEIADTFEISESATKMRLLRTKEKMKRLYLEHVAMISLIVIKILLLIRK